MDSMPVSSLYKDRFTLALKPWISAHKVQLGLEEKKLSRI
jgi:hypothetical protein